MNRNKRSRMKETIQYMRHCIIVSFITGSFSLQTNLKESSISSSLFDFRSNKICEPVNFDAKLSGLFGDNHKFGH